jgi:hypothetical protein
VFCIQIKNIPFEFKIRHFKGYPSIFWPDKDDFEDYFKEEIHLDNLLW